MMEERILTLRERIVSMSTVVDDMLRTTELAVKEHDRLLAHRVVTDMEQLVNRLEIENETTCIEFLALFQPEAVDLRTVIALLKINNAMERVADHLVNIAQRIGHFQSLRSFPELHRMFHHAQAMLASGFDSLSRRSVESARAVLAMDDAMDEQLVRLTEQAVKIMDQEPHTAANGISALLIGRDLERIGDLATNIAEEVVYLHTGEFLKHHPKPSSLPTGPAGGQR